MTDLPASTARAPISVTALVASARLALEREVGAVHVTGEVSGFLRAASGHCYFALKDANAQVRCVLWRTKARLTDFVLRDGLAVDVRGVASIYEPRGEFQLAVDSVRLAGTGALYERFLRLKAELEARGWFAAERKRPLPAFANAVGVVTSIRAAALRDVVTTLRRRWPAMRVIVYPCAVQGAGAAQEIAAAIGLANARDEVDALIVCRGGGAIEDLWAFNEEAVARAIHESRLPVVTGIGHETDFTIADFVADVRAPTPTGAATLIAPDHDAIRHRVQQWGTRIARGIRHALAVGAQRTDLAARGLTHPRTRLAAQREGVTALAGRAAMAWRRDADVRHAVLRALSARLRREWRAPLRDVAVVADLRERLPRAHALLLSRLVTRTGALAQNLAHLSPQHVLERGYAIVTRADAEGDVVVAAASLAAGDAIAVQFAQGRANALVRDVEG